MRKYIQRRWGVKLMRLLWGKPSKPSHEYVYTGRWSTTPLPDEREWRIGP